MEQGKFNFLLCEERHKNIEDDMTKMEQAIKSIGNRFLVFLTLLSLTLIGVVVNLFIQLTKQ